MFNIKKVNIEKELNLLKDLPGKERGSDYNFLIRFLHKYGEEHILNQTINDINARGFRVPPIEAVPDASWLPIGLSTAILLMYAYKAGWNNRNIVEFGREAAAENRLNRFFLKHFVSLKTTLMRFDRTWKLHYSLGNVVVISFDDKKRQAEIEIRNAIIHPLDRLVIRGVHEKIISIATGSKKIKFKEISMSEKKDNIYYRYLIKW